MIARPLTLAHFAWMVIISLFAVPIASAKSTGKEAELSKAAQQIAAAFSWQTSPESFLSMTNEGVADYCVYQIRIVTKARYFYDDRLPIPNLTPVLEIFKKYGIDTNWTTQTEAVFANTQFAANVKTHLSSLLAERNKLISQLAPDQLRSLATEIHDALGAMTNKPSTFIVTAFKIKDAKAEVALQLLGATDEPTTNVSASAKASPNPKSVALHCEFVLDSKTWKFSGIHFARMYDSQIALLNSLDLSKVYISNELRQTNLLDNASRWSFARSQQSEHCIVFWGKGYGALPPNSPATAQKFRVDVDDLLIKADKFFKTNVNKLKFANLQENKSQLTKYKLIIFLIPTTEWVAAGAGCDDVVGALWICPNATKPAGMTVAHEIGHCFQYQVYCDLKGNHGFRYGFGGKGGNGFWEQTAQWQGMQDHQHEIFSHNSFPGYLRNYHRHFHHEAQRYNSYFLHYYWAQKHGPEIIARIWREAQAPEDPIQAYMRITGINNLQFNDETYEAACRMVTWDIDALRKLGEPHIGAHTCSLEAVEKGFLRVKYDRCPGTTGYNVIALAFPNNGRNVVAEFRGLANLPPFNPQPTGSQAGWRYGFVALNASGKRFYGEVHREPSGTVEFKPPKNCVKLWFVVSGAPATYQPHPWDDDDKNDAQWPYEVKFIGMNVLNNKE